MKISFVIKAFNIYDNQMNDDGRGGIGKDGSLQYRYTLNTPMCNGNAPKDLD